MQIFYNPETNKQSLELVIEHVFKTSSLRLRKQSVRWVQRRTGDDSHLTNRSAKKRLGPLADENTAFVD